MDCSDIDAQLRTLEEAKELLERDITDSEALLELNKEFKRATAKGKPKTITTYTGDKIELAPGEWIKRAEDLAIRAGSAEIREMVLQGFMGREGRGLKPDGRRGAMINYSQFAPSKANVTAILEVLGVMRQNSDKGKALTAKFTEQVALREILSISKNFAANPREIFAYAQRQLKGIERLPATAVMVQRGKLETAAQMADAIEEIADVIKVTGAAPDDLKIQMGNVMRWAAAYESLDAAVATKVGQALRSRQYGDGLTDALAALDDKKLLELAKDLDFEEFPAGSLGAQVIEAIENGDPQKLKKIATAKRIMNVNKTPNNRPDFLVGVEILNNYRKDNLFSSLSTWMIRNPMAVLINFNYGLEDLFEGMYREGVGDGLAATAHAQKMAMRGYQAAWSNASNHFLYGDAKFSVKNMTEVAAEQAADLRQQQWDNMNQAWEQFTRLQSWTPVLNQAVGLNNMLNAATRLVIGGAIQKMSGGTVDAGYYASFRALGAFDEGLRKMSFDWKVNHEAYLRAAKEARTQADFEGLTRSQWIEKRADGLAETAVFSGLMTDDDLAKLRTREIGSGAEGSMNIDSDELRLKMFNDLNGVPNPADELGAIGVKRGDDITGTGSFSDPINQGIQRLRSNPIGGWIVPVWKTPANMIGYAMNRDAMGRAVRQIAMEAANLAGKSDITPEILAVSRARTTVSLGLFMGTAALWQGGVLNDGGTAYGDSAQQERESRNRVPYSINIGSEEYGMKVNVNSIDFFDIMMAQADLMRAFQTARISGDTFGNGVSLVMRAYAGLMGRKSSLKGLNDLFSFMSDPNDQWKGASLASSMVSGLMPYDGLQGNIIRSQRGPVGRLKDRRYLTPDEARALDEDPVAPLIQNIRGLIDRATKNNVLSFATKPQFEKDWTGTKIETVRGLPQDYAAPFSAQRKPKDATWRWIEKHGFMTKPRSTGDVTSAVARLAGVSAEMRMTDDEELVYREAFHSRKGEMDADLLVGDTTRGGPNGAPTALSILGGIGQYVQGRTFKEAITALRLDERYAQMLTSTTNNPSRAATKENGEQPNVLKSLDARKDAFKDPYNLYGPIQKIIDYYDQQGLVIMATETESFRERLAVMAKQQSANVMEGLQMSPMGIGRQ